MRPGSSRKTARGLASTVVTLTSGTTGVAADAAFGSLQPASRGAEAASKITQTNPFRVCIVTPFFLLLDNTTEHFALGRIKRQGEKRALGAVRAEEKMFGCNATIYAAAQCHTSLVIETAFLFAIHAIVTLLYS
jgi:hypothetical protein